MSNTENFPALLKIEQFLSHRYRISSVINGVFSFQNNPKVLDPSCKTDLELWHCLGRVELVLWQNFRGLIKLFEVILEGRKPRLIAGKIR